MKNNQIEKDLQDLVKFLNAKGIKFMVVGSLALETCGITLRRTTHDIDIEVIGDQKVKDQLQFASDLFAKGEKSDGSCLAFKFGSTTVNVWLYNEFSHKEFVYKDGVKYAGVMSVLRKKSKYGRAKDKSDLLDIINQLSVL